MNIRQRSLYAWVCLLLQRKKKKRKKTRRRRWMASAKQVHMHLVSSCRDLGLQSQGCALPTTGDSFFQPLSLACWSFVSVTLVSVDSLHSQQAMMHLGRMWTPDSAGVRPRSCLQASALLRALGPGCFSSRNLFSFSSWHLSPISFLLFIDEDYFSIMSF